MWKKYAEKPNHSGLSPRIKKAHLNQLAAYRDHQLRKNPQLRLLFIEMTELCNEHCRHCGSQCGDYVEEDRLSGEEIKDFLRQVKEDFDISKIQLCITGGEPLLRPDFFEIMAYARQLGYQWGLTSNGTLITEEAARRLYETGMRTVSISVDGLKESHEWFRQAPRYAETIQGVKNLLAQPFEHVQITTVIHGRNIDEMEEMYRVFTDLGVRSWRLVNIEPMGRAKKQPDLLLSQAQMLQVLDFIREKRFAGPMEVIYGCSHYLGLDYEREIRSWYFICNAGVYTASMTAGGDFVSCLDLPRRPELVEGNLRRDRFKDVWEKKYRIFRTDFRKQGKCAHCKHYRFCAGDSFHSWDFDKNEPLMCLKGVLFS